LAELRPGFATSTAAGFVGVLRAVERSGADRFVLDKCPRCTVMLSIGSKSIKTPGDALAIWASQESIRAAREEFYLDFALEAARDGRMEAARQAAFAAFGHVMMDDPRMHWLLAHVALSTGDASLCEEAIAFLRYLQASDEVIEGLEVAKARGRSDVFPPEPPSGAS
jgi:hypothetical protein